MVHKGRRLCPGLTDDLKNYDSRFTHKAGRTP